MNFLFGNITSQPTSQNQETPFFQHPNTRVSLFDNPPPSQSAFNLFNNEVEREKSLISQLEIFERDEEEKNDATPMRRSRMGETGKKEKEPRRELFQSRTRDDGGRKSIGEPLGKRSISKDRLNYRVKESTNFSFMSGQNSNFTQPDTTYPPLRGSRGHFDIQSNFQHYRRDQQKRQQKKDQTKNPRQVKEVRQKQTKEVKQMKETKEVKEQKDTKDTEMKNVKPQMKQEKKIEAEKQIKVEQINTASKKASFGFNLKRSRVDQPDKTEAKPETTSRLTFGFTLKRSRAIDESKFDHQTAKAIHENPPKQLNHKPLETKSQLIQSKTSLENRFESFDKKFFDIKLQQRDNSPVSNNALVVSRVKEVGPHEEQKAVKEEKKVESKEDPLKDMRENKQIKQVKQVQQGRESRQVKEIKEIEKDKKQPLGLKDKLRANPSKTTEKLEMKSIAFQLKSRMTLPKEQPPRHHELEDVPTPIKCEPSLAPSTLPSLSMALTPPTRNGKDSKQFNNISALSKPARQSDFSKLMLQLIQLMKEQEMLKSRVNGTKSTYRQIAMIANSINSKIAKITR